MTFVDATAEPLTPTLSPVAGGEGGRCVGLSRLWATDSDLVATPSPAYGRGLG
jgi:hypothetical protein